MNKLFVFAALVCVTGVAVEAAELLCPVGVPIVKCFADPCLASSCTFPNAECKSNYCGGCNAVWSTGKGNSKRELKPEECKKTTGNNDQNQHVRR